MKILNEHVDYFVIVESAQTFQNENKDFIFEKNKHQFSDYLHKIIYYKIEKYTFNFADLPYIKNPSTIDESILNQIYNSIDKCPHFDKKKEFWWGNDFFQRECIWRALAQANPSKDDMILISDVDEIPQTNVINNLKHEITSTSLFCFQQNEFCYFLNYYHNSNWLGTCCFLYGNFSKVSMNAIRFSAKRDEGLTPIIINNAGWHFTSLGSIDAIKNKIMAWSHRELNTKPVLKGIEYNVIHGYDIFRRSGFGKLICLKINDSLLPEILKKFEFKYSHLLGPEIKKEYKLQKLYYSLIFKINSKLFKILNK
jgi:beta-1,4-mannosyl-glycoprotein beta-1,4-N-acetylglucosaminyltransferase